MDDSKVIEHFQIPDVAIDIIGRMFSKQELCLIEKWKFSSGIGEQELIQWLCQEKVVTSEEDAAALIQSAFQRGVLNRTEKAGEYCLGSFYGRLDIFATGEAKEYNKLTREQKVALDGWYFDRYTSSMDQNPGIRPTSDEVLPLEDVLDFIENKQETPYLADCDCRMLIQNCDMPTKTCITYRTAPNSFVKRGLAHEITKEEARQIVIEADKKGLMHTINPGGVCNCCSDCCYLFRAARKRGSQGYWPQVHYQVRLAKEKCIGCGKCVKRCHFGVFHVDKSRKKAEICDLTACVGCGLCVNGCPTGALELKRG